MSLAYFIELDNKEPGFDPFVNGKFLAGEADKINNAAKILNLKQIDEYVVQDTDEIMEFIEDDDFIESLWFEADEGIDWTAKLLAHFGQNPEETEDIISDLKEYSDVLQKAKSVGAKWRLQIDY